MNIYDLITSAEIGVFWEESNKDRAPYLGETLFPNRKQLGLDLKYIKGRSGIPVVLRPSAFDVHVIPRVREGFDTVNVQMPFFKESYYIDEETRQMLIMIQNSTNGAGYVQTVLGRVFDDVAKLLESAAVTRERNRMQLLTTGVIAFAANGQAFEFDYGLAPEQKQNVTAVWTNAATADPIADLQAAIDYQESATGVTPSRILMNRYTFNLMKAADKVRNAIFVINNFVNTTGILTNDTVVSYISQVIGLEIIINNKQYIDETGATRKYVPDGVVVVMPSGTLGNTYLGTTPEEADLMSSAVANVSIVDTGVAITTMVKPDPVSVETKVSQITLPSFEMADQIVIIDTLTAA